MADKEFVVYGKITFSFEIDVNGSDEEKLKEEALNQIKEYYRLDVVNAYHNKDNVKIDSDICEYEDE